MISGTKCAGYPIFTSYSASVLLSVDNNLGSKRNIVPDPLCILSLESDASVRIILLQSGIHGFFVIRIGIGIILSDVCLVQDGMEVVTR